MKHKVANLEGVLLDAAVAHAEMAIEPVPMLGHGEARGVREWRITDADLGCKHVRAIDWTGSYYVFGPSEYWEDGGPIIERELIEVSPIEHGRWCATAYKAAGIGIDHEHIQCAGPTPLIAAMRAYTASVFGDEVELP